MGPHARSDNKECHMPIRPFDITLVAALPLFACSAVPESSLPDEGETAVQTELAKASNIPTLSGFGAPLSGIPEGDLAAFAEGQVDFIDAETLPALGPIFNSRECGA